MESFIGVFQYLVSFIIMGVLLIVILPIFKQQRNVSEENSKVLPMMSVSSLGNKNLDTSNLKVLSLEEGIVMNRKKILEIVKDDPIKSGIIVQEWLKRK